MTSARGARTADSKRLNSSKAWAFTLGVSSTRTRRQAAASNIHCGTSSERVAKPCVACSVTQRKTARLSLVSSSTIHTERACQGCHGYRTSRASVLWVFGCRLVQRVAPAHGAGAWRARSASESRLVPDSTVSASHSRELPRTREVGAGRTASRVFSRTCGRVIEYLRSTACIMQALVIFGPRPIIPGTPESNCPRWRPTTDRFAYQLRKLRIYADYV